MLIIISATAAALFLAASGFVFWDWLTDDQDEPDFFDPAFMRLPPERGARPFLQRLFRI